MKEKHIESLSKSIKYITPLLFHRCCCFFLFLFIVFMRRFDYRAAITCTSNYKSLEWNAEETLILFFCWLMQIFTMAFIQFSYRSIIYTFKMELLSIKLILVFCKSAKQMWFWDRFLLPCDVLAWCRGWYFS